MVLDSLQVGAYWRIYIYKKCVNTLNVMSKYNNTTFNALMLVLSKPACLSTCVKCPKGSQYKYISFFQK